MLLEDLRSALIGTRFAAHLRHFDTLDSTNTQLLAAAAAGAPEGTVYLAEEQTAGRGRGAHAWLSEPGKPNEPAGLYLSALIKPSLTLQRSLWLSLATGLAAQSAIHTTAGLAIDLRWPNDLMLGQKKLGGILVETSAAAGPDAPLHHAVIGIGINLNQQSFPAELTGLATSLRLATGHPQDRTALIVALLRTLDHELTLLEESGTADLGAPRLASETWDGPPQTPSVHPSLLDRFTTASTWIRGRRVHVPEQGGYTGTTAGLNPRGFLLIEADDNTRRTVLSGGVRDLV